MRTVTIVLALLLLSFTLETSQAQTTEFNISSSIEDCSTYCATVQIRSADTDFNLGGLSYVFHYNKEALSFLSSESLNFNEHSTICGGTQVAFSAHNPYLVDGIVSSGVAPTSITAFESCPIISSQWIDVAEYCFTITDEDQFSEIEWSEEAAHFVVSSSQNLLGSLPMGDKFSPDDALSCTSITSSIGNSDQLSYQLFPNPSQGSIKVNSTYSETPFTFSVIGLDGKVLQIGQAFSNEIIDLTTIGNGVYYLEIKQGTNTYTEKLVIVE